MRQAFTVTTVAILSAFAGLGGMHLGKQAISEVNPRFFTEKPEPVPFHDARGDFSSEHRSTDIPGGAGYYTYARPPVCWGCPEKPDPYLDAYVEPFVDPVPPANPSKARVALVVPEENAESRAQAAGPPSVVRYASFPITEDEARRLTHIVELQERATAQEPEPSTGM